METFSSLVTLLARRAEIQADERAYIFLSDRGEEETVLTFRELHEAAQSLAARLTETARPGDRALLVFPPGVEFLVAFFGCLIAGVIAVPDDDATPAERTRLQRRRSSPIANRSSHSPAPRSQPARICASDLRAKSSNGSRSI